MSVNVTEFISKLQEEGLKTLKQTQDASLAAINDFRKIGKEFGQPGTVPSFENLPTATQLVELSFGFAAQALELRKSYTLKIAELIVETQKQAEASVKAAATTVNGTVAAPAAKPAPVK
jgi:hypothetical protein